MLRYSYMRILFNIMTPREVKVLFSCKSTYEWNENFFSFPGSSDIVCFHLSRICFLIFLNIMSFSLWTKFTLPFFFGLNLEDCEYIYSHVTCEDDHPIDLVLMGGKIPTSPPSVVFQEGVEITFSCHSSPTYVHKLQSSAALFTRYHYIYRLMYVLFCKKKPKSIFWLWRIHHMYKRRLKHRPSQD